MDLEFQTHYDISMKPVGLAPTIIFNLIAKTCFCCEHNVVVACLCSTSLHDVDIISDDGVTFSCHKCVLDARVQYFHGLFSSTWIEVISSA